MGAGEREREREREVQRLMQKGYTRDQAIKIIANQRRTAHFAHTGVGGYPPSSGGSVGGGSSAPNSTLTSASFTAVASSKGVLSSMSKSMGGGGFSEVSQGYSEAEVPSLLSLFINHYFDLINFLLFKFKVSSPTHYITIDENILLISIIY